MPCLNPYSPLPFQSEGTVKGLVRMESDLGGLEGKAARDSPACSGPGQPDEVPGLKFQPQGPFWVNGCQSGGAPALRPGAIAQSPGREAALAWEVKVAQSCLTLCDPMDYAVHGILQARILEWVAFPFSRGSSQPRDGTQVSHIAGGFFTTEPTRSNCDK